MRFHEVTLALAAVGSVSAQRPEKTSICDYYTTALFKNNTAANQLTLLTALVNTVVIGNYTEPNVGVVVPGILAKGTFNGAEVNLLPFFDGTLKTTNRGGKSGVMVNFLDGGGAAPLKENKPANDENSKQYKLLTHLYQFFGTLLACSQQGMPGYPAYGGDPSMFKVHRFMNLDANQLGYFIQQVALAAASFGVAKADIEAVGMALNQLFGARCAPAVEVIKGSGPQLQSICVRESCMLAEEAVCSKYDAPGGDETSSSSSAAASSSGTMKPTETATTMESSATPTDAGSTPTGGAAVMGLNMAGVAVGVAALLL